MRKYDHETHTVWTLKERKNKRQIVFIKKKDKIRFIFKIKGKILPMIANIRFSISKHQNNPLFITIRLPFLYIEKNRGGISIGTPNKYIWFIANRRKNQ